MEIFNTVPKGILCPKNYAPDGSVDCKEVMDFLSLSRHDIANIVNCKPDSVRFDERQSIVVHDLFLILANLCELVAGYFVEPSRARMWFNVGNPAFENKKPVDILKEGKIKELTLAILAAKKQV